MTAAQSVAAHLERIDLSRATVDLVADHFGVSTATLRRRLAESGTNFKEIRNRERMRRLAEHTTKSGYELPSVTGHADRQSFYRWHKDFTGRGWRRLDGSFM